MHTYGLSQDVVLNNPLMEKFLFIIKSKITKIKWYYMSPEHRNNHNN